MANRKPTMEETFTDRSGDAGFVFQSKRTGATAYVAEAQGADPDGGKYVVICVHNRLVNTTSKRDARLIAGGASLGDICPACLAGDFTERALTSAEERA